ncbi:tail fiber domain-containing protein [Hymenobacter negativus]|uniref:Tail fiber domain-containing protein n=1 Tax=Hymenobacter negativus TaxID=2795026 RepID=A0ABS3Q8Z5_9BACT|nr:tail fiber domain-containing protein [Hymenobacter negativus]MBO2007722.1 tail fiber domain-containing protein [Hymenobacter negativus]
MNHLVFRLGLLLALAPASAALAQNVGIGITLPQSRLHVADGSVLFSSTGNVSGNALPISGAGRRLLWYADKAAFRVGYVDGIQWNDSFIGLYSFATGYNTQANGQYSFAAGDGSQSVGASSVAMGSGAYASAAHAVALGQGNQATEENALALGSSNIAGGLYSIAIGSGNIANGNFGITIGLQNRASASFCTAVGKNAYAAHQGAITLGDGSGSFSSDYITSSATNQMTMRFSGGYRLITSVRGNSPTTSAGGTITGVELTPGAGSWTSLSDRRVKENFRPIDAEQVLQKVATLPITEWNYKAQPATQRHVGPMAQDFYQAFRLDGIGRDTTINTVDIDGINMVAIQALYRRVRALEAENATLRQQAQQSRQGAEASTATLEERLRRLEGLLGAQAQR